ncbi:hypothetical protein IFO70_10470 [Phormidium tenue FACHB-886]|nr:hypothetical protein [Phormidium tenue FACHB-886]
MTRVQRRKANNRLTAEQVIELLQGSSEQEPKSIQDLTRETQNTHNHASLRNRLNELMAEGLVDRKEQFFRGNQVRWAYWLKSSS